MKIKITHEAPKQFFAEIVGELGIHAVGESAELALEYLFDVYEQVHLLKKQVAQKKLHVDRNLATSPLLSTSFKSLTLSL